MASAFFLDSRSSPSSSVASGRPDEDAPWPATSRPSAGGRSPCRPPASRSGRLCPCTGSRGHGAARRGHAGRRASGQAGRRPLVRRLRSRPGAVTFAARGDRARAVTTVWGRPMSARRSRSSGLVVQDALPPVAGHVFRDDDDGHRSSVPARPRRGRPGRAARAARYGDSTITSGTPGNWRSQASRSAVAVLGIVGDVDDLDVIRDRASEVDRLDDRPRRLGTGTMTRSRRCGWPKTWSGRTASCRVVLLVLARG